MLSIILKFGNIFIDLISYSIVLNLSWLVGLFRVFFSHQKILCPDSLTRRVISDKVNCLIAVLSYFRPDRFVSNIDLYLTLKSPSLNRSKVYWYLRVRYLQFVH